MRRENLLGKIEMSVNRIALLPISGVRVSGYQKEFGAFCTNAFCIEGFSLDYLENAPTNNAICRCIVR
jgi:hypothetical protein